MLIFIKYILPLFFILLVVWAVSSAFARLRNGKAAPVQEQVGTRAGQVFFRLFAAGLIITSLLAIYLQNS